MKKFYALTAALAAATISNACPFCNREISEGIYNSTFYPNLLTMLSAFIALTVIIAILALVATRRHRARLIRYPGKALLTPVPLATVAMVLGIGIGGFIDGIVLHQVLQWHEMLSNKIPATDYVGKSINMFWDGIFHAFCLLVVLIGVILLWKLTGRRDIDRSGRLLWGGLLAGWGLFNIVEGVIDHQILQLHNVMELSPDHDIANYVFLGVSVFMIIAGFLVMNKRKGKQPATYATGKVSDSTINDPDV